MKIKSLHLVKTSIGATWAYRVMRDLVKMGDEVHVAIPLGGNLIPLYKESGIIVHELDYSLKSPFKTAKSLIKVVKEVQPDIIHSHFVITTLFMRFALANKKIPRVFEVPGPLHLEHRLFRFMDIFSANSKYDFWIPTCKWSYNVYLKNGISKDRLCLTYYGSDLSNKKFEKGKLRKELHLGENDIIVGMVAYMYAPKRFLFEKRGLKGHEDLIDAFSFLEGKYPKLHLVFIGGAWNGAVEYERSVINYGTLRCKNIHFLGTRKDVPELYQDFDMVVHPSHSENLGGAAESLCLSVPTIATNVGGFPDIVIPGKTGFLVKPFSPQDIAEKIEFIINNRENAKSLALNGKKFVTTLLDAKNTSKDVYDFYRKMFRR